MSTKFFSIFLAFITLSTGLSAGDFSIRRHAFWTSTHFDIECRGEYDSSVEKSTFGVRSTYQLSNCWGDYGSAISRLISWGALNTKWKVLDVYDNGKEGLLSTIRGVSSRDLDGRFEFYGSNGTLFGHGLIDLEKGTADIMNYQNPSEVYVHFEAEEDENGDLYWSYSRMNNWFSKQIMHSFAALLTDDYPPRKAFEKPTPTPTPVPSPFPDRTRRHK